MIQQQHLFIHAVFFTGCSSEKAYVPHRIADAHTALPPLQPAALAPAPDSSPASLSQLSRTVALDGLDAVIASALAAASYLILRANPHGLTVDEIAAVRVHTSPQWASYGASMCCAVNRALESGDAEAVAKFAPYIQLLTSALGKFGSQRAVVSRRLTGGADAYEVGKEVVWTGFGSAQAHVDDADDADEEDGGDGTRERVVVVADCVCADVGRLCSARAAGERLIAPGLRLSVVSKRRIAKNRVLIVLSQQ